MSTRQQSKRVKAKCLICGTTYDPARFHGCPTCQRKRLKLLAGIQGAGK